MKMNYKNLKGTSIFIVVLLLLAAAIPVSLLFAVTFGTSDMAMKDVYSVIVYEIFKLDSLVDYASGPIHDIVWLIRLPRIVLAVAVGAGLAVCGAVMQAVVKNPMASPYTLGVSAGASLGATLAILLDVGIQFGSNYVGVVAFLGALASTVFVMIIANAGTKATTTKLLLAGMAVSAVASAFSSFVVFFARDKEGIQSITYWLMGSLAGANWDSILLIHVVVFFGSLFFVTQYRTLNLMLLGDDVSITLGTNLLRSRQLYMAITAFMIGFVVFSAGIIGFVGLIIPHIVRVFFGSNHIRVLPICFFFGGLFMIWADVASRSIIPQTELPIGILVSMIGAPTFIYLMIKKSMKAGGNL